MKLIFTLCLTVCCLLVSCLPSARFRSERLNEPDRNYPDDTPREKSKLEDFVQSWLRVPYKFGGLSRNGVDCSGFSYIVMRQVYGLHLPRSAADQYSGGIAVRGEGLLPGDLLFFNIARGRGIDHVGIYLGNDRFAHATESAGVIISDVEDTYYHERFAGACRYQK